MTLKERFKSLNTSFGADVKYYHHNINKCEKIADEFAIEFSEWNSYKYKYLPNKGWFSSSYELEMDIFKTSKELIQIFKKEKGL